MADLLQILTNVAGLTAEEYGVGPTWDSDGNQLWSDGVVFNNGVRNKDTITVCTFGDSTANATGSTDEFDLSTIATVFSGATTTQVMPLSTWGLSSDYPAARIVGNGGIGGQTVEQMLSRSDLAETSTRKAIEDILSLNPEVIIVRAGSINNLNEIDAGNYDAIIASTYSAHIDILVKLSAGGAKVFDEGFFGYSADTSTDPALTRQGLLELNDMYSTFADTLENVSYLSMLNVLHDATGNFLADYSYDGVHLEITGGMVLADKESEAMRAIFGHSKQYAYDGLNIFSNALFQNVTVYPHGDVFTNGVLLSTGSDRSNARVEVIDGRRWQYCEFESTGAGTAGIGVDLWDVPFVANDKYGIEVDVEILSLDGNDINLNSSIGKLDYRHDTLGAYEYKVFIGSAQDCFITEYKAKLVFPVIEVTVDAANIVSPSRLIFQINQTIVGARTRIGISEPRIVKI